MLYAWGAWLIFFAYARSNSPPISRTWDIGFRVENGLYIETRHRKDTLMNLSPAAAQAALDYAEELAATGLSSEQYDHYYL